MIAPSAYFEGLERGKSSAEGASALLLACRRARHPDVDAARKDASGDALADLVQEYALFLFTKQGAPQRLLLEEWRGVTVSFARYLKRTRRRDPSLERKRGFFQSLLFDKVANVLREEPLFAAVPPPRPARFQLRQAPPDLESASDDALASRLPRIPSRLEPEGKRSPQVVARPALLEQLTRIFTWTKNAPRTPHALVGFVWPTLEPPPDEHRDVDVDGSEGAGLSTEEVGDRGRPAWHLQRPDERADDRLFFEERVDGIAFALVESLEPRCAKVAHCRYATAEGNRARTLEEVTRLTGVPRQSAHRDCETFERGLAAAIERERLDERQAGVLIEVIWEILSCSAFPRTEGGKS